MIPGGDRLVTDVALAWGFGSLATFHRTFRQAFGVTPAELRGIDAGPRRRRTCGVPIDRGGRSTPSPDPLPNEKGEAHGSLRGMRDDLARNETTTVARWPYDAARPIGTEKSARALTWTKENWLWQNVSLAPPQSCSAQPL
jgi:hypothetical protein